MRLTQYTDYSLRVLIYLALEDGRLTSIRAISEVYGISHNHLMKVVQQLARKGYVDAVRGRGGGLRLARPPGDVNLAEVVRSMEPDFSLVECMRPGGDCVISPACVLPGILEGAIHAFMAELEKYTLADLLPRRAKPALVRLLGL